MYFSLSRVHVAKVSVSDLPKTNQTKCNLWSPVLVDSGRVENLGSLLVRFRRCREQLLSQVLIHHQLADVGNVILIYSFTTWSSCCDFLLSDHVNTGRLRGHLLFLVGSVPSPRPLPT